MKIIATRALVTGIVLAVAVAPALAGPPRGWGWRGDPSQPVEVGTDRTVAHRGKASGTIKAATSDTPAFGVLYQWIRAQPYRGKRIRVSAHLRTEDVGSRRRGGARLDLHVFGKTHRFGGDATRGKLIRGSTKWTEYQHVVDVPQAAVFLLVAVVLSGSGQVWVDDVKVAVVGSQVLPTGSLVAKPIQRDETRQRIQARLLTAPKSPVNLDFEQ